MALPIPRRAAAACLALLVTTTATASAQEGPRRPPYWMSIGATRALMRTGPARTYPGAWLYRRADLPVRVVGVFKEWRRVEDPDGTQGWMLVNLLRNTRTAMVRGSEAAAMRDRPEAGAGVAWRAAPGVVGRIDQCGNGWCRLDVKGRAGFVETGSLWGVEAGEVLP